MGMRNRWRIDRHLVVDDIDGRTRYDDELARAYDGLLTRARGRAGDLARHPQDFVRTPPPEAPLRDIRVRAPASAGEVLDADVTRGVVRPVGAATHLYSNTGFGIGTMQVSNGTAGAWASAAAFVVR